MKEPVYIRHCLQSGTQSRKVTKFQRITVKARIVYHLFQFLLDISRQSNVDKQLIIAKIKGQCSRVFVLVVYLLSIWKCLS